MSYTRFGIFKTAAVLSVSSLFAMGAQIADTSTQIESDGYSELNWNTAINTILATMAAATVLTAAICGAPCCFEIASLQFPNQNPTRAPTSGSI